MLVIGCKFLPQTQPSCRNTRLVEVVFAIKDLGFLAELLCNTAVLERSKVQLEKARF